MPASWRASDLTILYAAAAATMALTAASFLVAPPTLFPAVDGSSYASHPGGARGAYLLLQRLGYRVTRSFEPLTALAARDPQSTVVVLASPTQPASNLDVKALASFIEAGGHVVAAGSDASAFLPSRLRRSVAPPPVEMQSAALPSPIAAGVAGVEMAASEHALPLDSPYVPVFGTFDAPAVAVARFGQGRVVWWASSQPLSNDAIQRHGHLALLLNGLGGGRRTVVWDEYYHGHARSLWSYLAATPLPAAIAQLAVIGALGVFAFARRRAPIRAPIPEARTSPLEFVDTMGGLYERAGAARAAVSTIQTRVRRRLLALAGLPAAADDAQLARVAVERLGLDAGVGATLARAREAVADPALTSAQAVAVAAELQTLAVRARAAQRQRQRTS